MHGMHYLQAKGTKNGCGTYKGDRYLWVYARYTVKS